MKWFVGVFILFLIVVSIIGFCERKKSPPVTLNKAADHIIHNTLGGLLILKKKRSGLKYARKEIYYRAEAGEIEVFGTLPNGKIEKIDQKLWSEKYLSGINSLGFRPGRGGLFGKMTYGKIVWDNPRILESDLFRYWPPIPLLMTYRKIRAIIKWQKTKGG